MPLRLALISKLSWIYLARIHLHLVRQALLRCMSSVLCMSVMYIIKFKFKMGAMCLLINKINYLLCVSAFFP